MRAPGILFSVLALSVSTAAMASTQVPGSGTSLGIGCGPGPAAPALEVLAPPLPGRLFKTGTRPVPPGSVGALFLGASDRMDSFGPLPRFFGASCVQWCSYDLSTPAPAFLGEAQTALFLPNDPALDGVQFFAQSVHTAPGHGALGLAFSQALRLEVGHQTLPVRVGSYNIHHGVGTDGVLDLSRTAAALLPEHIDLIALQEVDRNASRSGVVDQAQVLASALGYDHVFGRSIPLGRGEYGNAILSRWPIQSSTVHQLPNPTGGEQRTVLEARIRIPNGRDVILLATHFDHSSPQNRLSQTNWVRQYAATLSGPVILAGDLNARHGSQPLHLLASSFQATDRTGFTFPAGVPDRRIDWILPKIGGQTALTDRVVPEAVASDHRPLWLDIAIE